MAEERDYYSILQLNRNASQDAIEKAYRRLAKIYDPATSRKPRAQARHREITEAYEMLRDKKSRAEYDRRRASGRPGSLPFSAAGGRVSGFVSRNSVWFGSGGIIASILGALALIVLLGGGGEESAVADPSPTDGPAAVAPATPPPVEGEEVQTESGLKYIQIQEGTGASPQSAEDEVVVHYTGWLAADGTKFDSSVDSGQPATFRLNQVIPGWTEGLQTMKEGGKTRLLIPAALGYGEVGSGTIPPNSDLIFDVELIEVRPAGGEESPAPESEQPESPAEEGTP